MTFAPTVLAPSTKALLYNTVTRAFVPSQLYLFHEHGRFEWLPESSWISRAARRVTSFLLPYSEPGTGAMRSGWSQLVDYLRGPRYPGSGVFVVDVYFGHQRSLLEPIPAESFATMESAFHPVCPHGMKICVVVENRGRKTHLVGGGIAGVAVDLRSVPSPDDVVDTDLINGHGRIAEWMADRRKR